MLCVAVLAAFGSQTIFQHMDGKSAAPPARAKWTFVPQNLSPRHAVIAVGVLLATLYLAEQLSIPIPLNDFRVPAIYRRIATLPGDFALLELPTGWRNGARVLGKSDILIMMQQWYQTVHGKRRLGGNTSRNPTYKFQYFTEAPLIGDLIALMNADQDYMAPVVNTQLARMIADDRKLAPSVLDFLNVKYVTVYIGRNQTPAALLQFIDQALPLTLIDTWQGLDRTGSPSTIRLYRVTPLPPARTWQANLAVPDGRLYLDDGWSALTAPHAPVRYATRSQADLLLNLPADGGVLRLELFGPATQVEVGINGTVLTTATTGGTAGRWVNVTIPPGLADQPVDRVSLHFLGPLTPSAQTATPTDPRGLPSAKQASGWRRGRP